MIKNNSCLYFFDYIYLTKKLIMKKLLVFGFLFVGTFLLTNAQKIKLTEGDVSPLKGQTEFNVVFTYNNMSVGKFDKEADYVSTKKADYNKDEAGRGDKWATAWVADRKNRYEPDFIELFEKNCTMKLGNNPSAKYTMTINTFRTEPGYNIAMMKKNAQVDLEIVITETGSNKVIAKFTILKSPGRTFGFGDFDTGVRIKEAYATAGKYFAKQLTSLLK